MSNLIRGLFCKSVCIASRLGTWLYWKILSMLWRIHKSILVHLFIYPTWMNSVCICSYLYALYAVDLYIFKLFVFCLYFVNIIVFYLYFICILYILLLCTYTIIIYLFIFIPPVISPSVSVCNWTNVILVDQ